MSVGAAFGVAVIFTRQIPALVPALSLAWIFERNRRRPVPYYLAGLLPLVVVTIAQVVMTNSVGSVETRIHAGGQLDYLGRPGEMLVNAL